MAGPRVWALLVLVVLASCTPAANPAPASKPNAPAAPTAPAAATAGRATTPAAQAPGAPAERVAINMPYAGRGVAGLAHYVAVEDGLYAKQGMDVTSANISSPPAIVAAVVGGEAPIASNAVEPTVHAAAGGAEIRIIGSNLNGLAMSIIAQPSIRTPQDLRGKRMGVTAYSSPTHTGAVLYLRSLGLDPQRDVPVIPIGGMPEIRGALDSGALDSAAITPPLSYALARAGFTELADLSKLDLKYQQGGIVSTPTYLRERPDVVRRIMAAYAEAHQVILTDKAAAQRVLAKWVEVSDPAVLDQTYELAVRGFRGGPEVHLDAIQTVIDLLAESDAAIRGLRAEQIVDNTFASEAARQYGLPR